MATKNSMVVPLDVIPVLDDPPTAKNTSSESGRTATSIIFSAPVPPRDQANTRVPSIYDILIIPMSHYAPGL